MIGAYHHGPTPGIIIARRTIPGKDDLLRIVLNLSSVCSRDSGISLPRPSPVAFLSPRDIFEASKAHWLPNGQGAPGAGLTAADKSDYSI